jgi:hypothetical protein
MSREMRLLTVLYFHFEEMLKRLEVHFEKWLNP